MTCSRNFGTALTAIPLALALAGSVAAQQSAEAPEAAETATGVADVANGTQFGDWVISCEAETIRRTVCRLVQTLTLQESDELVAQFIAVPAQDGAVLIAQVPMGVFLPGGAVYRFADDESLEQREMIWQSCQGQVCEAAYPLDEEELALMGAHSSLLFGYRFAADSEPIVVEVDISEFTRGMQILRDAMG